MLLNSPYFSFTHLVHNLRSVTFLIPPSRSPSFVQFTLRLCPPPSSVSFFDTNSSPSLCFLFSPCPFFTITNLISCTLLVFQSFSPSLLFLYFPSGYFCLLYAPYSSFTLFAPLSCTVCLPYGPHSSISLFALLPRPLYLLVLYAPLPSLPLFHAPCIYLFTLLFPLYPSFTPLVYTSFTLLLPLYPSFTPLVPLLRSSSLFTLLSRPLYIPSLRSFCLFAPLPRPLYLFYAPFASLPLFHASCTSFTLVFPLYPSSTPLVYTSFTFLFPLYPSFTPIVTL